MADRTFASMSPTIAPHAPGCPNPTIEQHIRRIAREVCEKTLTWRYEQPLVRLTKGIHLYEYDVPKDTEVVSVFHATINYLPISAATLDVIRKQYPAWPTTDVTYHSRPMLVGQLDVDHFAVAPTPDDTETYDARMVLAIKPTLEATGMDQTVLDDCEGLILHGVLQHLLLLPNKSWTDTQLASYHAKQYVYKTALKRATANIGAANGSLTVEMHPLA